MRKDFFKSNKRAWGDILYIVMSIMVIMIMLPVFNYAFKTFQAGLTASTNVTLAISQTEKITNGWVASADILFACIFFGLYLGAIITAFFVDVHPLYLVIGILTLIIVCWISVIYANAYADVTAQGTLLGGEMSVFPIMSFVAKWFAEMTIGMVTFVFIALYFRGGQSRGYA